MDSYKRYSDKNEEKQKLTEYSLTQINHCLNKLPLSKDQDSQIVYYPIKTDSSNKEIIYLSSKDKNNNINYKIPDESNFIPKKEKIVRLLPQRCVEFNIKSTKIEKSFISSKNNNENDNTVDFNKIITNNNNEKKNNSNKNNTIKNRQNNFGIKNKNHKNDILNLTCRDPIVNRSYSIDNYSATLNNSYTGQIYAENFLDSKIFNDNFISSIKSTNRKGELLKSLEKLRRIKSFCKNNSSFNRSYSSANIYQMNLQSNGKILNNNIVEEENENENSEKEDKKKLNNNDMNKTYTNPKNLSVNISDYSSKILEKINKNRIINIYENNVKNLKTNKLRVSSPNTNRNNIPRNESQKQYKQKLAIKPNIKNSNDFQKKTFVKKNKNKNLQAEKKNNKKLLKPEHYSPQTIFSRKLIREERYYIDEEGKEKIIEVLQSPIIKKNEIMTNRGNNNLFNGRFKVVNIRNSKYMSNNDHIYATQKKIGKIQNGNMEISPKTHNHKIDNIKIIVPKELNNSEYKNTKACNKLGLQRNYSNGQFITQKLTPRSIKKNMSNSNIKIPVIIQNEQSKIPNYKIANNNENEIYIVSINPRIHSNSNRKTTNTNIGNSLKHNHSFHVIKSTSNNTNNNIVKNNKIKNNYDLINNNQKESLSHYSNSNFGNSYRNYTSNNILKKENYQPLYTVNPYIGDVYDNKNIIIIPNKGNKCKIIGKSQLNNYRSGENKNMSIYNSKPVNNNMKYNNNVFHTQNHKHELNLNNCGRNNLKPNNNFNTHLYVKTGGDNGYMDNYTEENSFNSNSKKKFYNNGNLIKISTNMNKPNKYITHKNLI